MSTPQRHTDDEILAVVQTAPSLADAIAVLKAERSYLRKRCGVTHCGARIWRVDRGGMTGTSGNGRRLKRAPRVDAPVTTGRIARSGSARTGIAPSALDFRGGVPAASACSARAGRRGRRSRASRWTTCSSNRTRTGEPCLEPLYCIHAHRSC